MTALLYQLLRLALRCPSPQAELRIQIHSLSEKSWYRLFSISREQAVSALVFDAIGLLGCEESIPDSLAMRWMLEVQSIQDRACTVNRLAHELCASLETSGVHPILFNGPAVASCYPQPTLRTSGDIDLYFSPQEFKKARLFLASHLAPETTAPDGSFHYRLQDIDVDLHTRYYDFPCNEKLLPPVPSAPATLLMLSSHILKHALGPGVGLRQVCDLAMACRALKGEYNPEEMVQWFRVTNTYRWNRMLFSLIKERFELDAGLFPPGEHSSYAPLEAIIFSGGNFGHHAPSRRKALNSSARRRKWDTALRMMQRLPFALRYAPRQYVFYFSSLLKGNL